MSAIKACINCHFFQREVSDRAGTRALAVSEEIREGVRTRGLRWPIEDLTTTLYFGCYHQVWSKGNGVESEDVYNEIIKSGRNNCFFFPYTPGMMFPAATTLQKRDFELKEAAKDRKHTILGLWIAGGGLVVGAIISFVELIHHW